MTVSIANLNFSWSNTSNIYTAIGANVNAAAYHAASRLFSMKIDDRDIFYIDCNGVANIVNSMVIAGINVLPYIESAANSVNSSISINVRSNIIMTANLAMIPVNVANLQSAVTVGKGFRAFVTDANQNAFLANVFSGGANSVPVFSDGTRWKIG